MSSFLWLVLSMSGAASPLSLSCTVEGGAKAGLDPKVVCAQFVDRLSHESGRSYALVPVDKRAGDGMKVAIRFVRHDTVAAAATVIAGGRSRVLETRMISSSDRPLGLDSIGVLARDVARAAARPD